MRYWHIDRKINIRTDEEAQAALAKENDRDFLSENSGIIRVPAP